MGINSQDIIKMQDNYPLLKYSESNGEGRFVGEIILDHLYKDVRMTGKFEMEIIVPRDYPLALPTVMEISQKIDEKYPHKYINNQLCLASNLELKMYFNQDSDISDFVNDYIIPYLYTYQYYSKYGVYPYGERTHGCLGDLEYLKELLEIDEWRQLFEIMIFVIESPYRGHLMCPCNSGKKLRNCHGEIIKQMMSAGLREDCLRIIQEIYKEIGKK